MFAALAQRLDHTLGAIDRGAFLIACDQKRDTPAMVRMGTDELFRRGDHGGETTLHIRRTASEQHAVLDHRLERVAPPLLERAGRDDVRVPCEADRGRSGTTGCPEVLDIAVAQRLDLEAKRGQPIAHDLLATGVHRRDGVAGDEVLREFERRGHGAPYREGGRRVQALVRLDLNRMKQICHISPPSFA